MKQTLIVSVILALGTLTLPNSTFADADRAVYEEDGTPLYFIHLAEEPLAIFAGKTPNGIHSDKARSRNRYSGPTETSYRQQLVNKQARLEMRLKEVTGRNLKVSKRFQLALNAIVTGLTAAEVEKVRSLPEVVRVEPVERRELTTDRGPAHIGAHDIWNAPGIGTGNKGEGVIIGIIDTGIATGHPAFASEGGDGYVHTNPLGKNVYLGDCVAQPRLCNDKLIGVISYPVITDTYNGTRPADGYDYQGHGTHVASTAAGNILYDVPGFNILGSAGNYRFPMLSGVAPHANIVSYQVCFPQDGYGCLTHLTVEAVEHAIENGVHVLNYSIGGGIRDPWVSSDTLAFLSARAAGIHVATSAGNSGPDPATLMTPSNAPWLTIVAAYTHDRDFTNPTLADFSSSNGRGPGTIAGKGVTTELHAPVVLAAAFGDSACLQPFARGSFMRDEIVVCERGTNPRIEKGVNVRAGGAGGMILVNVPDGPDDTVADFHVLPAIHVDAAAGKVIRDWLATDSGHQVRITAGEPVSNPRAADIAGAFSSRGPAMPHMSVPSPHVAAPGVDIYAAWSEDQPFTDFPFEAPYAFLDGTSMSSPHVAGALALIAAAHPEWTPAEAQSALMSTAVFNTFRDNQGNLSTPFDTGSGRVDLVATMNAGLVFPVSESEYRDADPRQGGAPTAINLPAVVDPFCLLECAWTRTVKAVRDGSWSVVTDAPAGIELSVTPSAFSLSEGDTLPLQIEVKATQLATDWQHARVHLQSDAQVSSDAHIPVSVLIKAGEAPDQVTLKSRRNTGTGLIKGFRSIATDELHVETRGLVKAMRHEAQLKGDPTPDDPFDNIADVVHVVTISTTTRTRALIAEIISAESPDLDLFIARDSDLDGKPIGRELLFGELCVSGGPDSNEKCVITDPPPGTYWIAVHNYRASAPGASDHHVLAVATIEDGADGLIVTAPATSDTNEHFSLSAAWDLPMAAGDIHYAVIDTGIAGRQMLGRTLLRLDRIEDDFSVGVDRTSLIGGESLTYAWSIAAVSTDEPARRYRVSVTVPEQYAITAVDGDAVSGLTSYIWEFEQIPGAAERTGTLQLTSHFAEADMTLELPFEHSADGNPIETTHAPAVSLQASPVALIKGETSASISLGEGETTLIDASTSKNGDAFHWLQIEGPTVPIEATDKPGIFQLSAPTVAAGTTLKYQLTVSRSGISSTPAELVVALNAPQPDNNDRKGGGGSTGGLFLLALLGLRLAARRINGIT